ncbi:MAG: hypothetical protein KBF26_13210 [Opitutaceae bacterium]|nr:hypothetical protein [Opitutaceae bacterium]
MGILILVMVASMAPSQTDLTGKTEAEVVAEIGSPASKSSVGARTLYRWADVTIAFENGRVTKIEKRDPQREAAIKLKTEKILQERAQLKAAAEARRIKAQQENESAIMADTAKLAAAARDAQAQKEQQESLAQQTALQEAARRRDEYQKSEQLQRQMTAIQKMRDEKTKKETQARKQLRSK